ncbi:hypothetical protein Tco_1443923, partial [Tanacetum coccineum]
SFASAVPGQMTHLVANSTLDSANSCVMQGASCTQREVSMVFFDSFLSSILLLVVIIVMVVVIGGVSSIFKLSFVIIDSFSCYWSFACPGVLDTTEFEEEDGEWICFLGGSSSSGTKKYQGSNSSDGGNTGDGVKIAGGVIGSGDEIAFSEELKELLPAKAGK